VPEEAHPPGNGQPPPDAHAAREGAAGERSGPHPPLPRDKRGWQVAPSPDGRGMPEHADAPRPPHRRRGFLWFVLGLLALNWVIVLASQPGKGEKRVTVPFSPYFLEEVKGGHVKSINSKGNTVEGKFKEKLRYPANDQKATPTKLFATEVPTFWNGSQLSSLSSI